MTDPLSQEEREILQEEVLRLKYRSRHDIIELGPEEREEIGPTLARIEHDFRDIDGLDLIDQIVAFVRQEASHSDLTRGVTALRAARRTFQILVQAGFPHESALSIIDATLYKLAIMARKELVRRLMCDEITGEAATKALSALQELVNTGQWPAVEADISEVEAALCMQPKTSA